MCHRPIFLFRLNGDALMKETSVLISISKPDSKVEAESSMSFSESDPMPPDCKDDDVDDDQLSCPVPSNKRNSLFELSTTLAYADDDQENYR